MKVTGSTEWTKAGNPVLVLGESGTGKEVVARDHSLELQCDSENLLERTGPLNRDARFFCAWRNA